MAAAGYGKRFSRAEQRQRLSEAWVELTGACDAFTLRSVDLFFDNLRQTTGDCVRTSAFENARAIDCEESAFAHLKRLMDDYRGVTAYFEERRDGCRTLGVRAILEGIYSVLASRLKQFEEADAPDNPVTAAKQAAYDGAAVYAAQHIDSQIQFFAEFRLAQIDAAFRRVFLSPRPFTIGGALAALDILQETASSFCFRSLHTIYTDSLRICADSLEALTRQQARRFCEYCENELEVLASIIKVQVNALEYAAAHSPAQADERETAEHILNALKEAYQYFGGAAAELRQEEPYAPPEPLEFEVFERFLLERLLTYRQAAVKRAQGFPAEIMALKAAFITALEGETDALFEQARLDFFKSVYRMQRVISEEVLLAGEMSEVFGRVHAGLAGCAPPPEAETEAEIIRGIAEAVEIKVESMRESAELFDDENTRLINDYASDKKDVTREELIDACDAVLEKWTAETETAEPDTDAFFESCASAGVLAAYRGYYEKREAEFIALIDRRVMSFRRETLLYEISTFEEILIYSAPRLRESAFDEAARAALLLDDALKSLETLLRKSNIYVIRPAPHDAFNGREHEVLVAEPHEGFSKGEIIKPLGSGYKYKDAVILRANVIAAK